MINSFNQSFDYFLHWIGFLNKFGDKSIKKNPQKKGMRLQILKSYHHIITHQIIQNWKRSKNKKENMID